MMMINNRTVYLGECVSCGKAMQASDFLHVTFASLSGEVPYACKKCQSSIITVKLERPSRNATCEQSVTSVAGAPTGEHMRPCIICGVNTPRSELKVIRTKDGAMEGSIPYCLDCARKFNI